MRDAATNPILQRWVYHCSHTGDRFIVPDGCRDLLHFSTPGERPRWSLSPLQSGVMAARLTEGTTVVGYRLVPGVELPEAVLPHLLDAAEDDPDHSVTRVLDDVRLDPRAGEALATVAALSMTVAGAAGAIGASRRTLERLPVRHTGNPPVFWSQLARVRAVARALARGAEPLETAYEMRYADQAHLSRSVRRWFGVSRSELVRRPDLSQQLFSPGYDAVTGEQISTR